MINFSIAEIQNVVIHQIGNKTDNEGIRISEEMVNVEEDGILSDLLKAYFLKPFKNPEFYAFTFSNDDHTLNPLFQYASAIFDNEELLYNQSIFIAKHLYEKSTHPNIKTGDLMIVLIKDLVIEEETVDALGIFKSESKDTFLQLTNEAKKININYKEGINIEKLDKGCLIINTEKEEGYKIAIIDKAAAKNNEAQYWKNDFLNIIERNDDYHATKNYIELTQSFIKDRLIPMYELDKTEEAGIVHRSKEFFKKVERFEEDEYDERIFFENEKIIHEFQEYKKDYQQENQVDLESTFFVSPMAVKKQSKFFRSVLKLDKNFHIYIHGNHDLIEKGKDEKGTFYKVYYENES